MNKKTASLLFLGICILLAVLLLLRVIDFFVSGVIFAAALVLLGILSGGFRKE